eukprot:gene10788-16934_t
MLHLAIPPPFPSPPLPPFFSSLILSPPPPLPPSTSKSIKAPPPHLSFTSSPPLLSAPSINPLFHLHLKNKKAPPSPPKPPKQTGLDLAISTTTRLLGDDFDSIPTKISLTLSARACFDIGDNSTPLRLAVKDQVAYDWNTSNPKAPIKNGDVDVISVVADCGFRRSLLQTNSNVTIQSSINLPTGVKASTSMVESFRLSSTMHLTSPVSLRVSAFASTFGVRDATVITATAVTKTVDAFPPPPSPQLLSPPPDSYYVEAMEAGSSVDNTSATAITLGFVIGGAVVIDPGRGKRNREKVLIKMQELQQHDLSDHGPTYLFSARKAVHAKNRECAQKLLGEGEVESHSYSARDYCPGHVGFTIAGGEIGYGNDDGGDGDENAIAGINRQYCAR